MPDNLKDAIKIIELLGLPKAQQSEMPALCLLALVNMTPKKAWKNAENPLIGITPIIEWIGKHFDKKYAPNTRETIRKNAMHKFVDAGVALANPDKVDRSINSPRWVYQIDPSTLELLRNFRSRDWTFTLETYLSERGTLSARYAQERFLQHVRIINPPLQPAA